MNTKQAKKILKNNKGIKKIMDIIEPEEKHVFLVIGSNNFWYAQCDTLKCAKECKKEVLKHKGDEEDYRYGDEESGHKPFRPERLFIFKAIEL